MVPVSHLRTVVSAAVCVAVRPQLVFPSGLPSRRITPSMQRRPKAGSHLLVPRRPSLPGCLSFVPHSGGQAVPLSESRRVHRDVVSLHLV